MFSNKARPAPSLAVAIAALALAACGGRGELRDPENPSGFKVPRYVSIRSGKVNGRAGPSEEHPILWTYTAKGLPVQVVAETQDWRRICDPEGGLSWVKRSFVGGERSVMRLKGDRLAVHRRPAADSPVVAYLNPRGVAALDHCDKGWCRIEIGEEQGWTPESEVWGTAPAPQCRGASGMTRGAIIAPAVRSAPG
jgi:SH3-like domain-containing protein